MCGSDAESDGETEAGHVTVEEVVKTLLPRTRDDPDAVHFSSPGDARLWDERARGLAPEDAPPEALLEERALSPATP